MVDMEEIKRLPLRERLKLVDEIWESCVLENPDLLQEEDKEILNILQEREEEYLRDPSTAIPWDEAIAKAKKSLDEIRTDKTNDEFQVIVDMEEIKRMPLLERLKLVDEVWDSCVLENPNLLQEEDDIILNILEEREEAYLRDPSQVVDADDAIKRIKEKLRNVHRSIN